MKEYLLKTIQDMIDDRKSKSSFPFHITRQLILAKISDDLNKSIDELINEGKIIKGNTLNDTYYDIK